MKVSNGEYSSTFVQNTFRLFQSNSSKASLAVIIASVFNAIVNIIVVGKVSRDLGPESFSSYASSLAIGGLMSLSIGGFQIAVAHKTAESALILSAPRWTLNRTLLNPFVGVGFLLGFLWLTLSTPTSHLVGINSTTVASLAIVLPISAAVSVVDGALFGLSRFKTVQALTAANTIFKLVFVVIYLQYAGSRQFLPMIIYLSAIPTVFAGSILIKNDIFSLPSLRSIELWTANFVFFLIWICLQLDLLITRKTLTHRDAGLYASVATIGKAMTSISMLISFYAIPKSVQHLQSEHSTRRVFNRTAIASIILGLLVTVATVSTNAIFQIFGSQFNTERDLQIAVLISYIPWACLIALGQLRITKSSNRLILILVSLASLQILLLNHASELSDIPPLMFILGTLGAFTIYILPISKS